MLDIGGGMPEQGKRKKRKHEKAGGNLEGQSYHD